jgi:transglutaminase-like putative cysteine protease
MSPYEPGAGPGARTAPAAARAAARPFLPRWPGWAHLPRDARDVLFLLAVIGWTVAPHFPHLPLWCPLLVVAVIAWRTRLAVANAALPGRWPLTGVLLLAAALTLWSHRTLLGKDAGITMLVVLMALKTLELRARRDAMVVFFLGFFIVLTNFLYSQSLAVAAAMLASVWGLLTALVLAHMPVGRPPLARAGAVAAKAALLGAPIMVMLFMLFPRMAPLWPVPQDTLAKTGLSGSLRMGGIAELAIDDSIAFRVLFDGGAKPPPAALYWRGPVLARFDGREWNRLEPGLAGVSRGAAQLRVSGAALGYEMTLEPNRLTLLPLLEATPATDGDAPHIDGMRAFLRSDLQWVTERPVTDRLRLTARAYLAHSHGPQTNNPSLRDYLDLPPGYNPRTLAWADALRNEPRFAKAKPEQLVDAVMHTIRSGFTYTLTPGTYGDEEGRHAIDEFWLDRKQGFCEHFSTAFVVVMRALDIPARVVTGFQGADPELQDGYHVVRNSYAHAWAEVWLDGRGWVRVDPTAAVAPERVVASRSLRPQLGVVAGVFTAVSPAMMAQLRSMWEQVNNRWNQWVLNYSRSQQFDLLQSLGVRSPSWEDLAYLLIALLCAGSLLSAGWAWWDHHRRDPWQRLHARVMQRLAALGVAAAPHEAPRTLAARVRRQLGANGAPLAAQLEALDQLRYGRDAATHPDPAWWRGFAAAAAALPRPR